MGQKKKSAQQGKAGANDTPEKRIEKLQQLRLQFSLMGKAEWWWVMDATTDEVSRQMRAHNFAVMDGFLLPVVADAVRQSVVTAHKAGRLLPVGIMSSSSKAEEAFVNENLRSDRVSWVDKKDAGFEILGNLAVLLGTLVSELSERLPELKCINSQTKFMAVCYPPGSRYTAHVDHDGVCEATKPRRLTAILYLNPSWVEGDGGELVMYEPASKEDQSSLQRPPIAKVAPLHNRLLVFWPDWRVPHEVSVASKERYAVTLWFMESEQHSPGLEGKSTVDASEVLYTAPRTADAKTPPLLPAGSAESESPATIVGNPKSTYEWSEDGSEVVFRCSPDSVTCMEQINLDISSAEVVIQTPYEDTRIPPPDGLAKCLDVDAATASFSKKKRQLVVRFPRLS
eukprot:TRINITY_DN38196_c0_g1_i1.p1 TRINITY_DN38196_c0_g1~~TRINITY_DN38196_c0_g1_i1.p1  ORF type:complete len:398 (-),score=68.32 TRINITY_DN38196_c0_g1_i1:311-1504(-)